MPIRNPIQGQSGGGALDQALADSRTAASVAASKYAITAGSWWRVPTISRLRITGTGSLSINSRNGAGAVTSSVFSGNYSGANGKIEFPYYGDEAVEILATFPNTLTVEVI